MARRPIVTMSRIFTFFEESFKMFQAWKQDGDVESSGTSKDSKKSKKNKDNQSSKGKKTEFKTPRNFTPKETTEDGADDEPNIQVDVDMIDALTGIPAPEDELLFAIPVIAPYNTLSTYKYKVKLTPGTGKRGKAARTAVTIFLKDRTITQREKDILKAVKDDQLARNLPGKVKLSAPKLQTLRK